MANNGNTRPSPINPTHDDIGRKLKLHGSWRGEGTLRDFDRHWIYVDDGSPHGIATLRESATWADASPHPR